MVEFSDNDEVIDATEGGNGAPTEGAKAPEETTAKAPIDPARAALVKRWLDDVKESEKHWDDAFKRMDVCRKIAAHGTSNKEEAKAENGTYLVPILNRFINQAVASLYAKNPKAVAKRKDKLLYVLWDGDPASIMTAMQIAQQTSQPQQGVDPATGQPVMVPGEPDPQAVALLTEVQQVKQQLVLYDRMAKTMGLLFSYYLEEQDSGYEEQFKALVRRTKVCGVAYVDLDFQRILKKNPDVTQQIADTTSKIATIEAGLLMLQEGKIEEDTAAMAELQSLLEDLQNKEEVIAREGPVLGFPRSDTIIPDKNCKHLKTFAGCRWVARRYDILPEAVLETWKVDVGKDFTAYMPDGQTKTDTNKGLCRVYRVQDKKNQQVFVICEGYPDFIVAPAEPTVVIERFWTVYPLIFNEVEPVEEGDPLTVYPPPDVWNARHMSREYNSQRQGLREHRIAGRPGYAAAAGKLEDNDKKQLGAREAFEVVELLGMTPGEDIKQVLQAFPVPGVDPNLYDVGSVFEDIQRTVGAQEANFGGTSNSTATESSIAENSRSAGNGSDVDDLDKMLSALARGMGQLMLSELAKETVLEIAGPGAIWPDMPPTREQVSKDLLLEIEAGSSGRPNRAAELANFERAMPFVTMLPGINPTPIGKKYLGLLDIDVEDAMVEGLPSITAMNQMAGRPQPGGAGPDDPRAQGEKGANNAPGPNQANEPAGQPAHPAPAPGPSL